MSLTHITFIRVEPVNKVSPKTGKPYSFLKLEGIAHEDNGVQSVFRYDFWPLQGEPLPSYTLGDHVPVYGCAPHWETAKLEPRFIGFRPLVKPAPKP